MTGQFESAADAMSGALAARAIDGRSGGVGHDQGGGAACLNCGAPLQGSHCHRCGQAAHLHRTMRGFAHDIAHGVFHLEGRMWSTLPLLAWRPGALTRRYVHGERAKFVSPLALFLFSVFLMVAVFHWTGGPLHIVGGPEAVATARHANARDVGEVGVDIAKQRAAVLKRIDDLTARRAALLAAYETTASVDKALVDARAQARALGMAKSALGLFGAPRDADAAKVAGTEGDGVRADTGIGWFDTGVRHVRENPELVAYKMQSNAYKFSWALIPISLPFIWLIFAWRRDVTMYDHAIFATYSLSAMTLLVVALSLLTAIGVWTPLILLALLILPPLHIYRQLKGAYLLGRFAALWRTCFLLLSASVAGGLFFALLVTMQMGE